MFGWLYESSCITDFVSGNQNMAKQAKILFLEEWLRNSSGSVSNIGARQYSTSSARAIIQAWADLRDSLNHQSFHSHHLQCLKTLFNSQVSLYVADPQAKLLISILSSSNLSFPHESYPLIFKLLYIWIQKSSKPSSVIIDSSVDVLSHLFSVRFDYSKDLLFFSEGFLLLASLSFAPTTSNKTKRICLELLCRLLEEEYQLIGSSEGLVVNVLAGIGYALSSSETVYFVKILDFLFGIWDKEGGPSGSVSHGLMILHLIEWVLSNFINSRSSEKINILGRDVLGTSKPTYALFAVVMASAGVLRASSRFMSSFPIQIKVFAEERIETIAKNLISGAGTFTEIGNQPGQSLLLQCISLGLARSGPVSSHTSLFICLASALLTEIFPLQCLYAKILGHPYTQLTVHRLDEAKECINSITFKEAGAISGVLCNQYVQVDEESKSTVENIIWDYCKNVYLWHRQVLLMLQELDSQLLGDLEKIVESAFLMVALFASAVKRHRLDSIYNQKNQLETSVRILVSFSCMEYFRRMHLPEYMDTIRGVVGTVQENEQACISFLESIPSYRDLTNQHSSSNLLKVEYVWSKDEVQTARILFYLRVIPTSVERISSSVFAKVVAPTMFLYMGHPNGTVARASHSLFAAFISSGKDSDHDERVSVKEQLVFYYMQRCLEVYPLITPFEGMASGVCALVRHLPAGSPSIFYCIHSLVDKASSLCNGVIAQEADIWNDGRRVMEACKKLVELLLRLIFMLDIQVLPTLMKLLAQLIVQLPSDGQSSILSELYVQVAESDDVTRKLTLVSWLQSLSYICLQDTNRRCYQGMGVAVNPASAEDMSALSLHRINARL